ncbi:MAG: sulfite exporter TauE/SafE family protein [Minwuia sp.]|uniref:sulfite exporter TauE/SafE family protein n=1 Tax=Minwuia sp. TaxID=2493630 RepID=UPI003A8A9249
MPEIDTLFVVMAAAAFGAGLMRGFAGFGSAMVMSPLLSLYYGPVAAVMAIAIMEVVVSVQLVPKVLKHVEWPLLLPATLAAFVGMPLGVWALVAIDGQAIALFISGLVLLFVLVLASGWRYSGNRPLPATLGIGTLCGALITSTSVGGPPLLIYMMAGQSAAQQVRANIIVFFAILEVITPFALWIGGRFDAAHLVMGALFCPTYLVGAWIGTRLFRQSSEALYRRVALILLSLIAVYGLAAPLL